MGEEPSRRKMSLLARKKTLSNEIKYYENKIEDARSVSNVNNFLGDDSSDSEHEFTLNTGLSITELKLNQRMLKTCLHATQELTSVTVLQSEVNVLVQDPVLEREPPVQEEGVWREVTAECRIDLVPFSISFYVHKPTRMFAPICYRNLQVTLVKSSHEVELTKSVLSTVKRPSDAVEMIRNYSAAHRSRRSTLARLAEKYSDTLLMEPLPEGGYVLKCGGLIEVQWTLQNKWSPLAPFHHRMVFDLEFMDESYIKLITQLHRQIIDPTLETDERTLLLAKIISTCLEAKSCYPEQNEGTESESENAKTLENRRTTLDQEPEAPERHKKKDSEVMAPPKSLPKKSKSKGKENAIENKSKPVKRTADMKDVGNPKKSKVTEAKSSDANSKKSNVDKVSRHAHQNDSDAQNENRVDKTLKNSDKVTKKDTIIESNNSDKFTKKGKIIEPKNSDKVTKKNTLIESKNSEKITKKDTIIESKNSEVNKNTKKSNVDELNKNDRQNNLNIQNKNAVQNLQQSKNPDKVTKKDKNNHIERLRNAKMNDKMSDINVNNLYKYSKEKDRNKNKMQAVKNNTAKKTDGIVDPVQNKESIEIRKEIKEKQNKKISNKLETENNIIQNIKQKKLDNNHNSETLKKTQTEKTNKEKTITKQMSIENSKESAKLQIKDKILKQNYTEKANKPKSQKKSQTDGIDTEKSIARVSYLKNAKDVPKKPNTMNYIKNQFLTKNPQALTNKALSTKIPRKRLSSITESSRNNPLRISPRKLSNLKPPQDVSKSSKSSQKSLQKVTNIPRLLKKPQTFKPKV